MYHVWVCISIYIYVCMYHMCVYTFRCVIRRRRLRALAQQWAISWPRRVAVCMYINIYIYINIYTYVYIYIYIYIVYIYIYMYYVCVYLPSVARAGSVVCRLFAAVCHELAGERRCLYVYQYMCLYMCVYMYVSCVCVYIYLRVKR